MSILLARAQLFAAIEGGSISWNEEIIKLGPIEVRDRLLKNDYSTAGKITERLKLSSAEEVMAEIAKAGAFILTPEDVDWPLSLNDLAAPPIALLIKGQREYLPNLVNSISIVGTRNPTQYGARIAGDFGVGVADHCAGSAGNTDVPLWRYQIPAIFYAPKIIKPQIFAENVSQIDVAPTVLGMMNLSYKSKFFGTDVLNNRKNLDHHSFVSTYTDIGYFKDSKLYLLKPKKEQKVFNVVIEKYGWNASKEILTKEYSEDELRNAIAYYQVASSLFKNDKLKNFAPAEEN